MGNRIKELREQQKISLSDLSKMAKIPKSSLSEYEKGDRQPRNREVWDRLAEKLNVSVPYIMGLSDEKTELSKEVKEKFLSNLETIDERHALNVDMIEGMAKVLVNSISEQRENPEINSQIMATFTEFITFIDGSYLLDFPSEDAQLSYIKDLRTLIRFSRSVFTHSVSTEYKMNSEYNPNSTKEEMDEHLNNMSEHLIDETDSIKKYLSEKHQINSILDKYYLSELEEKYS